MDGLPNPFGLGNYFTSRQSVKYSLGASDAESKTLKEILGLADAQCKGLWENLTLSYPDFDGNPLLREEVASIYGLAKEDVLIAGPQDGIYVALTCLTRYLTQQYGDTIHAIYTYPCYQSLDEPLRVNHCMTDQLEIIDTGSAWRLDIDDLKALIKPNTKLLILNFPHSPTGYVPSRALWEQIIALCKVNGIFIFCDEMYWWLNTGEALTPVCMQYTNAISLGGLAKTCGVPGLRIGWLCTTNKELLKIMRGLKDYTSQMNCTPGEILGIITLRNREKILEETRGIVNANLVLWRAFVKEHSDILECHDVKAGSHTLVRLKGWALEIGENGKAEGFCDALFEEEKVTMLPASLYNFHRDDYVRVGLGRKNMQQALECLGTFIKRHTPDK